MSNIAPLNIAIVGAGICGLGASLALARKGHKVTIFERDVPPPPGGADEAFFDWDRKGAGQFRHPHAFLGLMCNILRDNYPELLTDFEAAGARRVGFELMLPPEMAANYVPEPGDEDLWVLMCRRAVMETVLRAYTERQGNITIKSGQTVTGLIGEGTPVNVTGLQLGDEEVSFDIVVDCSGRTTKFPGWLRYRGAVIEVEDDDAEIVYFTRHYKVKPGQVEPAPGGKERGAGDLGYLKYGVFPGENGHFAIILCVPTPEVALRKAVNDPVQFDAICHAIPGTRDWVDPDLAEPTTDSFGFGDIRAVWRHYVNGEDVEGWDSRVPVATNFFAIGDAAVRTNPLYGRGCSTGMLHAHILADILEEEADPIQRALILDQRTEDQLRPIFKASLDEDRAGIKRSAALMNGEDLARPHSLKAWFAMSFGDAMAGAALSEIHVIRGFMRTFHLLEKPGDFLKDKRIRNTILRYMLRGRSRNASARIVNGPDRAGMLAVIADEGIKRAAE
ncbi:MAG: FAD-dependent monooxygenase [Alphaproteobacteria bacterium]|nr:MAG: FAD-dependent monooxygenase [Alphaproteobacteria bacterium]